jgi:hypothetical protein
MPEGCRSTIKALGTAVAALLLIAGVGALVIFLFRSSQPAPAPVPPPRTATAPAPAPALTPVATPTAFILPSVTPTPDAAVPPEPEPPPGPTPTALVGVIEIAPTPPAGTPEPPPAVIAIRDSQAEEIVMQQAGDSGVGLTGLDLTFDGGQVVATGELRVAGLLGKAAVEGPFKIVGRPRLENGVLKAELTALTVRGADVTNSVYRPLLEAIANDWLQKWLAGKRVASVTLEGGTAALAFAP